MRRYFLGVATAAILAASIIAGCGGQGGGPSSFQFDPPPEQTPPPQQTIDFTIPAFGAADRATLVFSPGSTGTDDTSPNTLQVTSVNARVAATEEQMAFGRSGDLTTNQATPERCGTPRGNEQTEEVVNSEDFTLRSPAAEVDVRPRWDGQVAGTTGELFAPCLGDPNATFTVVKMLDDANTVHCNVLAQVTDIPNPGDAIIDAALAQRIADIFDDSNPFDPVSPGTIGIYDRLTQLCGNEWRTNPVGGRDSDQRINIVVCDSSLIFGALGLVCTADELSSSQFAQSNTGEYLYVAADLAVVGGDDLENYSFFGTIAHEFMHVIQENTKFAMDGTFANLTDPPNFQDILEHNFLSEGGAETGATLCGFGIARAQDPSPTGGADDVSMFFLSAFIGGEVVGFPGLISPGFTAQNPFSPDENLTQLSIDSINYGGGHLFGVHIVNRFGAATWGNLTRSPYKNTQNLNTNLPVPMIDTFNSFGTANYADQLIGAPGLYSYPQIAIGGFNAVRPPQSNAPPDIDNIDSPGFDASGAPNANFSATVPPWGAQFIEFTGGDGSPLNMEINIPTNARARLIYESPAGTFTNIQ